MLLAGDSEMKWTESSLGSIVCMCVCQSISVCICGLVFVCMSGYVYVCDRACRGQRVRQTEWKWRATLETRGRGGGGAARGGFLELCFCLQNVTLTMGPF